MATPRPLSLGNDACEGPTQNGPPTYVAYQLSVSPMGWNSAHPFISNAAQKAGGSAVPVRDHSERDASGKRPSWAANFS